MQLNSRYFLILLLLIFLPFVSADTGPKPTVDINVLYNDAPITGQFTAIMLYCGSESESSWNMGSTGCTFYFGEDKECMNLYNITIHEGECYWRLAPLARGGPCSNSKCGFGYFPPDRFRLGIYIPETNHTFITDAIDRNNFNSRYQVKLYSDRPTSIKETTPIITASNIISFTPAFIITVLLELFVAWRFVRKNKWSKKLLGYVFLANVISLPLVWFVIPYIHLRTSSILLMIILYELFAFVFEAYFLYWTNKKFLDLKKAFTLSLVMNAVSLFLGGILYGILMLVFLM